MAKYKAYPEYKDSGVEWLGEIPEHWKLSKLRYQFVFSKGLTITKEHLQDEGIPCVNYGEVHSKYGFEVDPEIHTLKCVSDKYLKDNSNSLLAKGDIVFADTSEDIDGSGNFTQLVSDTVTFAGYHTIIARPFERENSRFYAYLLDCKELRSQVRHAVKGVKVFSITQAILRNLSIWLPSKDEQAQIAAFLDHETAKIDNLIEKQQQLIELLKEKRQAVISHAVTKGLNPDVPMKDSDVEWLGEIPEHWALWKFSHIAPILTCGVASTPTYVDAAEGMPFLSAQNVKFDKLHLDKYNFISVDLHKQLTKNRRPLKGDLLVTRVGAGIGEACVIDTDMEFSIYVSLTHIRLDPVLAHNRFIMYFFNSSYCHFLNYQGTVTGGGVGNLNVQNMKDYKIALPCIEEQKRIVSHLDLINKQFDILTSKAELGIKLMQERRTALISAAVTGKIDVRDWVAPDTQEAQEPQEATA